MIGTYVEAQKGSLLMSTQWQGKEELAVSLSVRELRALVRDEIIAALDSRSGSTARQVPGTQSPYLSVPEAAEAARISVSAVRQAIRAKQLAVCRAGRRVLVTRKALQDFLEKGN